MLPLAGSPRLVIVGREVRLGSGYADLLAIGPEGRLAVIEIKLARNAEARRAVVAQALAYAAYLYRMNAETLERDILRSHLVERGYQSLADAVAAFDQEGEFDPETFSQRLQDCLQRGHLRVVFVLDEAPAELVQLLGFLEAVSDGLVLDLVTVSAYEVNGSQILVPQRVEPEKLESTPVNEPRQAANRGTLTAGPDEFIADIAKAEERLQPQLQQLVDFALRLEAKGFAELSSYRGAQGRRMILLPRIQPENVGLVTLWNENGAVVQFWRSVFERKAPSTLKRLEQSVDVCQGNSTRRFSPEILDILDEAYSEANRSKLSPEDSTANNGELSK